MRPLRRPNAGRQSVQRDRCRHRRRTRWLAGPERLEQRTLFAGMPYGAMPDDTAEYMLGDVYVTVVLMESGTQTNSQNNNSETWTPGAIAGVKQRVAEGLQWWEDTLATRTDNHQLNFQIDFTYADSPVTSTYEPITRSIE